MFWNVNIWEACLFIYRALTAERLIYPGMCLQTPSGSVVCVLAGEKSACRSKEELYRAVQCLFFTATRTLCLLSRAVSRRWTRLWSQNEQPAEFCPEHSARTGVVILRSIQSRLVPWYHLRHLARVSFYCWLVQVLTNSQLNWMHLHCVELHLISKLSIWLDMTVLCSITHFAVSFLWREFYRRGKRKL